MRWLHRLQAQLSTLRRSQAGSELDRELQFHLDQQIAEFTASGMSPEESRRAALRSFGPLSAVREETRSTWSWLSVEGVLRDFGFGLRSLSRSLGFTLTAILVTALGLGGNIAIFAVVRSVLLKPLPFPDSSRLIVLYQGWQQKNDVNLPIDAGSFWEWQRAVSGSAELALVDPFAEYDLSLHGGESPEKISAGRASWNLFHLLGVQAALGRTFQQSDDSSSAQGTVILSDSVWRRRCNADPSVIGTQIWLNGRAYAVIGVLPPWFQFENSRAGERTQIWLPVQHESGAPLMQTYEEHDFIGLARLAPGVTAASVSKQLAAVQRQIKAEHPVPAVRDSVRGHSLLDDAVSGYRAPLLTIFGAAGCVLLIACFNVGSLMVARTAARRKELAIRTALGASRLRLLRERLVESFLLAMGGGLLGLTFARAAISWLVHTRQDMNRVDGIHIDPTVIGFAAGGVAVCAFFSALIGTWGSSVSLLGSLQESARGNSAGQVRTGLRRSLLAVEVALTVILLVGAGLLLKSYLRMRSTDLGISADNALTMQFNLPRVRYGKPAEKAAFMEEVLAAVRGAPGVKSAGLITTAPGQGRGGDFLLSIPEHGAGANAAPLDAMIRGADPGYFAAAGIPILRGRTFDLRERLEHADVAILSQKAARELFPNEDPLGKHVRIDYTGQVYQIAGVVGDTRWTVNQP